MTLSLERAAAVMSALIDRDISALRLNAVGFGANRPVAPNDSEKNKALNRRVEVRVMN